MACCQVAHSEGSGMWLGGMDSVLTIETFYPKRMSFLAPHVALATINATAYAVFAVSMGDLLKSVKAQRRLNISGGVLLTLARVGPR